ncbi:MAG: WD40 repeat domain-containing protein [Fimbriiglobus sp.]|jgi:WD40 repeat protein|nr:WD40 repeat domain-containing protein [Fimbriiglobus sp.]
MRLVKLKAMKRINALHFTPDGRNLLAVGGAEVRMQDWAVWVDVAVMEETLRIPMHAQCAAVSADLSRIAVGNARPFLERENIPPVVTFDATDPTWHEDESRWQTVIPASEHYLPVVGLAFDPKGKRLAVSYDATDGPDEYSHSPFVLLPLGIGKSFAVSPVDDPDATYEVLAFSPDGQRLAATGGIDGDPSVTVINARTAKRVRDFAPPGTQTRHLVFRPGGDTLAVVNGKRVFLYPPEPSTPRLVFDHPKQVNQVAFTPDGRRLLSTCHDGLVRIWDTANGLHVTSYDWGIGQTTAVAVSPDGLTAALAGQKGQIAMFDLDG